VSVIRKLIFVALLPLVACSSGNHTRQGAIDQDVNVLVIVIDTLAAKHLGSFTPGLRNSPTIDKLAAEGVSFRHAYSTAPWTQPAVASMFTSLMPTDAGVTRMFSTLPDSHATLTEIMRERGRWTMGVTSNWIVTAKYGFGQGFEKLNDTPVGGHEAITGAKVTEAAKLVLDRAGKRPFYLYVHYFDPHWYFNHHPQFDLTSGYKGALQPGMDIDILLRDRDKLSRDDLAYLENLYREEIAYTDDQVAQLLAHLQKLGLADNTLVVLTADHGEAFMEHDWIGHTANLYDELIHVPLIFSLPGRLAPREVNDPVSLLDILPTLAGIVGAPAEGRPWQGLSLQGYLDGTAAPAPDRTLLAEVSYVSPAGWPSGDGQTKRFFSNALRMGDWKAIHDLQSQGWELYNFAQDPGEQKNLWDTGSPVQSALQTVLREWEQSRGGDQAAPAELDAETLKKLRSLGYVH
jgi:arylsulfatase A-like enzyme